MNDVKKETNYVPPSAADGGNTGSSHQVPVAATGSGVVRPDDDNNQQITFSIVDMYENEFFFTLNRQSVMSTAFQKYFEYFCISSFSGIYFATWDGHYIPPTSTPDMIGLNQDEEDHLYDCRKSSIYCINKDTHLDDEGDSCYRYDRKQVVNKPIKDAYGYNGTFTGVLLTKTGSMPHGRGKMVYIEDFLGFYNGSWRHGRWYYSAAGSSKKKKAVPKKKTARKSKNTLMTNIKKQTTPAAVTVPISTAFASLSIIEDVKEQ